MGDIDAPQAYIDMYRLIAIIDAEHELMRWRLWEILEETQPIQIPPGRKPDPQVPAVSQSILKCMEQSPYGVILHKDPPRPEPYELHRMVDTARAICHKNLAYLDNLERELEQLPEAAQPG